MNSSNNNIKQEGSSGSSSVQDAPILSHTQAQNKMANQQLPQQHQQAQSQSQQQSQQIRPVPNQRPQQNGNKPQQFSQQDLNRIVLEYLNKKGYHKTESMLRLESSHTATPPTILPTPSNSNISKPSDIGKEKAKQDLAEDPEIYYRAYNMLKNWVESSLDLYKPELSRILYPIFIHCYLELVTKKKFKNSKEFFDKFSEDHKMLHGLEISKLSSISLKEHLNENKLAQAFKEQKYRIIVSKTSLNLLLYFLHENEGVGGGILIRIINQHLDPIISTTRPDKEELEGEANPEEGINGYFSNVDEIKKFNDQPVKLGKLPMDSEFTKEIEAELKHKDEQKNNSRINEKTLLEEFSEMTKEDDDSPSKDALPLPMKTSLDLKREILAVQDSRAKIKLGAIQAATPSVCLYTFHNTNQDMTCMDFNDNSTMIAAGFQDSFVKLWSIDGNPLRSVLKNDKENDENSRRLVGHSGAVYGVSFSPDNRYLLSSSADKTVRLWSLDTYTSLVSYKGHNQPVWDVKFSPFGHYFATASHDQTARLWSCDHIYPLRIFAGHYNDVDCVEFHPNSTYVFTGSSDKTCRMWDISTGQSVRVFLGHSSPINCLAVSPDGRWLASAGEDSVINVWDIGSGRRLKSMRGHGRSSIYSLSFSREGSVLVSGSADYSVRVWDIKRGTSEAGPEPEPIVKNINGANENSGTTGGDKDDNRRRKEIVASVDHMTAYFTKKTPVYKVHFTRRNLCLAGGAFLG